VGGCSWKKMTGECVADKGRIYNLIFILLGLSPSEGLTLILVPESNGYVSRWDNVYSWNLT